MELWGGIECTLNRVGGRFRDQFTLTGHYGRDGDLEHIAKLGIRKMRYPVLWEQVAPDEPETRRWQWSDARIAELARLGVEPILGLLHHGSGPAYTGLLDDNFAALLAGHAAAVAQRYPHVRDWTPINEPLTTARFSALYGHWYPHARDERLFWNAVLNQIDAARYAMAAIREVVPDARLIQTEDLGTTYSTATARGVADFYNHRSWMTWDLLSGLVVPGHALWDYLSGLGLRERLVAIADDPSPPDVIGINHYVTSHRFLDDRIGPDPLPDLGYRDVEAVRAIAPPPAPVAKLVEEACARYRRPVAVTETHLACSREEQIRWLYQTWQDCLGLSLQGIEVEAVTAWALLGAVDWHSLLTTDEGRYEAGAFDVSAGSLRLTALGRFIGGLTHGNSPPQQRRLAQGQGWWQRDIRLAAPPFPVSPLFPVANGASDRAQPILISGSTGTLGEALAGGCRLRGLPHVSTDRRRMPIDDPAAVARVLDEVQPWAVINAAGWVRVDEAEDNEEACYIANAEGGIVLANACKDRGIHCTVFSSDLVFDGSQSAGWVEDDVPNPLNAYGRSKAALERRVLSSCPRTLVIRTAAFFSPFDRHNFAWAVEDALRSGAEFAASDGHFISPTYVPHLVHATLNLIVDGESGIWHLSNREALSWFEFARRLASDLDLERARLSSAGPAELGWSARRPVHAALKSKRGILMPPLSEAIEIYASERASARGGAVINRGRKAEQTSADPR